MPEHLPYGHIIIHGVGLIGGSVAASVRRLWPNCRVTGIGRNAARLRAAQKANLLTDWAHSIDRTDVESDAIVVVCLPVDSIPAAVIQTATSTPSGVLITDAGSVKESIQAGVNTSDSAAPRFVGAHPIAGGEQAGFEHADSQLFSDRPCIVTTSVAGPDLESRCQQFWSDLGAVVSVLTPAEHDRILAVTSHLPHILAAISANCLAESDTPFVGTGFRDTTRVAAGDPSLWQQILTNNREQVLHAMRQAEATLCQLADALEQSRDAEVEEILSRAAKIRRGISNH